MEAYDMLLEKALDETSLFTHESDHLIENCKFRKAIKDLLAYPELGEMFFTRCLSDKPYFDQPSNCHGTTLFVLGLTSIDRPVFVLPLAMEEFLKRSCNTGKSIGGIVALYDNHGKLCHTGIYLGNTHKYQAMFHQPNTGEEFTVHPVELHMKWKDLPRITYFTPKTESEIWVPGFLTEPPF